MKLDIKKLLEYGVMAPSGDNTQPWSFRVLGDTLHVLNNPERDKSLYNSNQHSNHIALGALIENIVIASTHFKYHADVNYFPDSSNSNFVAEIKFIETGILEDPLFSSIEKRCSNRKPYDNREIPTSITKDLEDVDLLFSRCELKLVNPDSFDRSVLANAVSSNEKIVLENKLLHNFLFKHITWTKKEDQDRKAFFVDTLELKGPQKFVFRIVSTWSKLMSLKKFVSISDIVAKDNAKTYSRTGLFLAFCIKDLEPESFLEVGRCMQRSLLVNTSHGVASQILGGITLLALSEHEISKEHRDIVNNSYRLIKGSFKTQLDIPIMARVGYAKKLQLEL